MYRIIFIITYPIRLVCYGLIYFYKIFISPFFGASCKFKPSCSTYMLIAIKEWGIIKGIYIGTKRILRCNPWSKASGVDMVPLNLKGERKWIF